MSHLHGSNMRRLPRHSVYTGGNSDALQRKAAAAKLTHKKSTQTGSRQSEHHRKKDILCLL